VTVSDDELVELLQTLETMALLADVECASNAVLDWIKAHPGEARVIQDISHSKDLFSHMKRNTSNLIQFALNSAYIRASITNFKYSKSKMDLVMLELSRPVTPNRPRLNSYVWTVMRLFVSSLCASAILIDLHHAVRAIQTQKWKFVNETFAEKVREIVVWNREQYIAQQASIQVLQGDPVAAIRTLSVLEARLKDVNPFDLFSYTGLPYAPGPGEEL
jgi:hypothetical protein